MVSIPMLITMPQVLNFWLGQVPEYTISFCRYMLVLNLVQQFSMGIMTATQAIGKIKRYQLVVGTIQILTVPISYFALKAGYPAEVVMISSVSLEFIASCFRVYYFRILTAFPVPLFLKEVVLIPLLPSVIIFSIVCLIYKYIELSANIWQLVPFFATTIVFYIVLIYLVGISLQERNKINMMVKMFFGRVIKIKS